jgi:anti-sigma factor RsiW
VAEVTASHIRSLMSDHLLDVVSTDRHTVKPWFNGKLDFSPVVIDLTTEGFPLIGGRLDYVANRPVAAIVYRRHQHLINLYTWPASSNDSEPTASEHNGYHVLKWTGNGMSWVAVSDLNPQELGQFSALLRPTPTTRP